MAKAIVVGFSILASSFSWALPENVKVLKQSGDCYLVKTENGREAVYVERTGESLFIGYVGKIRKGTPLYHWGNATPDQAAKWDAAGSISPDLLNYLISTNAGAHGGGFYASLSRTDSMNYGNTQITIVIPHEIKIIDQAKNPDRILNRSGINEDIAKLGISAFRNQANPTWHNFIDVNSLTKEHVTTMAEWRFSWRNVQGKVEVLERFPELLQSREVKSENKKYLNYLNLLKSSDINARLTALEYFYSTKNPVLLFLALKSVAQKDPGSQRLIQIAKEAMRVKEDGYRIKTVDLFSTWQTPESTKLVAEYYREFPEKSTSYVTSLLSGRQDSESLKILKDVLSNLDDLDSSKAALARALSGRSDAESLELVKQMFDKFDPIFPLIALKGRQDPQSLDLIESLIPKYKSLGIAALKGRRDERSLQLIARLLKDPDTGTRDLALEALDGRIDSRIVGMIEPFLGEEENLSKHRALEALAGQQDEKSLALIKRMLKNAIKGSSSNGNSILMALYKRTDAASLPILEHVISGSDENLRRTGIFLLLNRTDAKANEVIRKLIKKNLINSEMLKETFPESLGVPELSSKQIEKNVKALPLSESMKFSFAEQAVLKSVKRHVNAPACKNIFSM